MHADIYQHIVFNIFNMQTSSGDTWPLVYAPVYCIILISHYFLPQIMIQPHWVSLISLIMPRPFLPFGTPHSYYHTSLKHSKWIKLRNFSLTVLHPLKYLFNSNDMYQNFRIINLHLYQLCQLFMCSSFYFYLFLFLFFSFNCIFTISLFFLLII